MPSEQTPHERTEPKQVSEPEWANAPPAPGGEIETAVEKYGERARLFLRWRSALGRRAASIAFGRVSDVSFQQALERRATKKKNIAINANDSSKIDTNEVLSPVSGDSRVKKHRKASRPKISKDPRDNESPIEKDIRTGEHFETVTRTGDSTAELGEALRRVEVIAQARLGADTTLQQLARHIK